MDKRADQEASVGACNEECKREADHKTSDIRLEKKLSPLHVWSLAFGCIIGSGAFFMPGTTFLPKAGVAGTGIAMGIAAVMMIIIALNYNYMINRYPVAGGEFTYTQKAFGRNHAFVCAWFLGLSYLAIVPFNATALAMIGRNLVGGIFQVGFHYSVAGYDIYMGEMVLAVVALILFAWLSIKGVKFTGGGQTAVCFALMAGVLIVTAAAVLRGSFTADRLSPAFYPGNTKMSGVLAVVAIAPFAFVGFDTIPQAAEEFRFSTGKTKRIMLVAILFGAFVYVILNTVTAAVVPEGYVNWAQYIDDTVNLEGVSSLPAFYAAFNLLGKKGIAVLGVSVCAAALSGIIGFYMATSRLLYAMAKERYLPDWFARLSPRYKTPVNAILFILCISLVAPVFGRTALGWIVDMSSVGAAIGYGYTSAAALKYARAAGSKGIMFTGIVGIMMAVIFLMLLLVPVPGLGCSLGKESYICLIVWTVLGAVFYARCRKP